MTVPEQQTDEPNLPDQEQPVELAPPPQIAVNPERVMIKMSQQLKAAHDHVGELNQQIILKDAALDQLLDERAALLAQVAELTSGEADEEPAAAEKAPQKAPRKAARKR